jgi:hypothetical protein
LLDGSPVFEELSVVGHGVEDIGHDRNELFDLGNPVPVVLDGGRGVTDAVHDFIRAVLSDNLAVHDLNESPLFLFVHLLACQGQPDRRCVDCVKLGHSTLACRNQLGCRAIEGEAVPYDLPQPDIEIVTGVDIILTRHAAVPDVILQLQNVILFALCQVLGPVPVDDLIAERIIPGGLKEPGRR